jgi:2-amino-4-hydroxy-6-hydroxymethyldihydropteridine diphosphokinase
MVDPISLPEQGTNSAMKSIGRAIVVGIGANLGDRLATLTQVGAGLAHLGTVEAAASLWESDAIGPPQDRYWNTAVRLRARSSAPEIVRELLRIEASLGRVRTLRWGPRVVDLDLLWIDGEVSDDPDAEVPHPRMHERSFALTPLLEVAPDAIDPRTGAPFVAMQHPPLERIGAGHLDPLRWTLLASR